MKVAVMIHSLANSTQQSTRPEQLFLPEQSYFQGKKSCSGRTQNVTYLLRCTYTRGTRKKTLQYNKIKILISSHCYFCME